MYRVQHISIFIVVQEEVPEEVPEEEVQAVEVVEVV